MVGYSSNPRLVGLLTKESEHAGWYARCFLLVVSPKIDTMSYALLPGETQHASAEETAQLVYSSAGNVNKQRSVVMRHIFEAAQRLDASAQKPVHQAATEQAAAGSPATTAEGKRETIEIISADNLKKGVDSSQEGVFERVRDSRGVPVSFAQLGELHHEEAPSEFAYEKIWTHCQIVARIAVSLAANYRERARKLTQAGPLPQPWNGALPDLEMCAVGGLIHDIGVQHVFLRHGEDAGRLFDRHRYIFHGLEGYLILLENRYGLAIAQFARNHTGVGITRSEVVAQGLPLPPDDYMPKTIEQEIVMYADKFHTKSDPMQFVSLKAARASAARFGLSNATRFDNLVARYGVPDLESLSREYGMSIR